jgi:hypothetical protein
MTLTFSNTVARADCGARRLSVLRACAGMSAADSRSRSVIFLIFISGFLEERM